LDFIGYQKHKDDSREVLQTLNEYRWLMGSAGFSGKWDLIVLLGGFQKKTQKTPIREIKKAERIKKEYYESK
jgi:hypothetical protein